MRVLKKKCEIKSRKLKFFTLTHGVTLSTTVANLEKSTKDKKTPQEISFATFCINFKCSYSSH